jgi:acid stress-induced BolA-like protein IbaG/YrbA
MDTTTIADLIRDSLSVSHVEIFQPRGTDDDDHWAAVVVSEEFEEKTLVEQHKLVYDALGDHMTKDIHALELKTYTPAEYEETES